MQVFDTHAHLLSDAFDDDREQVIARIQAAGVCLCMEAGTTLEAVSYTHLDVYKRQLQYGGTAHRLFAPLCPALIRQTTGWNPRF